MAKDVALFSAFLLLAAVEIARPWRATPTFAVARWTSNLAIFAFSTGLEYLAVPVTAMLAFGAVASGPPSWLQYAVGVLALDALNYALHRAFHASPVLWRLHALHHADPELDVTTTVRHHPVEALLTLVAVNGLGGAAGLSPLILGLYASLNLCVQLVSHANIGLPKALSSALGWLLVTPVLHRVHHSRHPADGAANYGLVFSVWDRLLGTYRGEPEFGEDRIEFGIDQLREQYYQRLDRMLWSPFYVRGAL